MKELQTADDVEAFMLRHGERIVDMLGEEVDRIERELKVEWRMHWSSSEEKCSKDSLTFFIVRV